MIPDLSFIIVSWNTKTLLAECLDSIYECVTDIAFEVFVVDNGSTDGSIEMVRTRYPDVRLMVNSVNVGFACANNQALALTHAPYALLLNSDARVTPGAVKALLETVRHESRAAIVGAQLRNPDGSFQSSHTPFPTLWREFLILSGLGRWWGGASYPSAGPEEELGCQDVDYVEGACLLVRLDAVREVGGMDEGYFMYAEEVDWCFSMKQHGWRVLYQPDARIIHHGGASSVARRTQREADLYSSRIRLFRKHRGDGPAWRLKCMIFTFTIIKRPVHLVISALSGRRYGRTVIPLRELRTQLWDIK